MVKLYICLTLNRKLHLFCQNLLKKLNQVLTPPYVWSLQEYLTRIEDLRGHCKQFFISYLKLFRPVSRSIISLWLKKVIKAAGTNVANFKLQNIWSASKSEASLCSVQLDQIMSAAGWTLATTFARFFNKPTDVNNGFTDGNLLLD